MSETTERRTLTRDMPDRSRIIAHLEIRQAVPGGLSEGFSLTGEVYEPHGTHSGASRQRNGRECDAGGCIHDELLRAFPKLVPFQRLHLSDLDGVPMHALANAWYFYSGGHLAHELKHYGQEYVERHGTGYERACRTLRVESIPSDLPNASSCAANKAFFAEYVETLEPQWKREAQEARELFDSIEGGER